MVVEHNLGGSGGGGGESGSATPRWTRCFQVMVVDTLVVEEVNM